MSYEPQSPLQFIPAPEALPAIIDALPPDDERAAQFRFSRARQALFLKALADCGEVRAAARAAAVSHQTVYRLRRACTLFKRGCDAALVIARQLAEDVLATRAMHGVEEEVFYHGEVVAKRRRYDSRLLLAHLARLDRMAERDDLHGVERGFDALVAAFECEDEEAARAVAAEVPGTSLSADQPASPNAPDSEEGILPSGPCNMRSMSRAEAGAEAEAEAGAEGEGHVDQPLETRLAAMEAARPHTARPLRGLASSVDELDMIEAVQLAAFEAGEERWWERLPDGFEHAPKHAQSQAPEHAPEQSRSGADLPQSREQAYPHAHQWESDYETGNGEPRRSGCRRTDDGNGAGG